MSEYTPTGDHVARFLFSILNSIASAAASGAAYQSWPDDFARKEARDAWAGIDRGWGQKLTVKQLQTVRGPDRQKLGFSKWDDEGVLILIPLWAFNVIADGEELTSISGETKIKGQDEIDLDVRFGCIAWGFPSKAGDPK